MNRTRTWLAFAALATTLAATPMRAAAQEVVPVTADPLIIVGWQDDDGGPIMGHASDIQALNQARAQAQQQAQAASNADLFAAAMDCAQ